MRRSVVAFVGLLVWAGAAAAQTEVVRLTLDDAITRGIDASHRLADLAAREEAARSAEAARRAAAMPQIAAAAGYTRTNHVEEFGVPTPAGGVRVIYPDIPDNYRSRVDLHWPIYTAGRVEALTRAAAAEADAVAQDLSAARADLKLEITRAYWSVITARASTAVLEQALARTGSHLADVRNQLRVGLIPPSDVLAVEAQEAHQRMLLIESQNIAETAAADLRRLAGLQPAALFELEDRLEPVPASGRDVSMSIDIARAERPERKALETRVAAAAERVAAAEAGHRPSIAAAGGYDFARPNPTIFPRQNEWKPSWSASLNVSWQLWDGGRTRAETAEAAALRRAVEARLREFDSVVEVEVRQRTLDLAAARAAIAAAEAGVRSASEARRVIADRFAAGVATNTDVLTAEVALLQAELDRTRSLAGARLAAARLDRALGR